MRWGMVIDLTKCTGCFACMLSCKQEHFLPPGVFWARVVVGEDGRYPSVQKQVLPVLCNHCQEAPCQKVCPTGATQRREDGIIWVDYDKCMGCRYCVIACPYQHRTYLDNQVEQEYFPGKGFTTMETIGHQLYPFQKGTVVKCNFCMERIDEGVEKGLKPGLDRPATPACVVNCPTGARVFGDLDDPASEASALIRTRKGFQLHHEFETDPSVWYIRY
jgi:molybdopterin-containing oxidoreductase family iron-sulfur binding subunit